MIIHVYSLSAHEGRAVKDCRLPSCGATGTTISDYIQISNLFVFYYAIYFWAYSAPSRTAIYYIYGLYYQEINDTLPLIRIQGQTKVTNQTWMNVNQLYWPGICTHTRNFNFFFALRKYTEIDLQYIKNKTGATSSTGWTWTLNHNAWVWLNCNFK